MTCTLLLAGMVLISAQVGTASPSQDSTGLHTPIVHVTITERSRRSLHEGVVRVVRLFTFEDTSGQMVGTESAQFKMLFRLASDRYAPPNYAEEAGAILCSLAADGLVFATFFFLIFRRMLFNRRMDVTTASFWSNILTLLFTLIAASAEIAAFTAPNLFGRSTNTYLGLAIIFLGLYLFGTTLMMLLTRRRALRS